jgi:hypothetical protein
LSAGVPDNTTRLITVLGIMLSSNADGEIVAAAGQARKLMKAEGLDWNDIAEALTQRGKLGELLEVAKRLRDERDRVVAENQRLKQFARGTGPNPWAPEGSAPDQAAWALQLHADGVLGLNQFEESFLLTISEWEGELRPRQRPVFEKLISKIVRCTGQRPP